MSSIWSDSVEQTKPAPRASLNGDITTDVLVVGGGIAGLLCAYKLRQKGVPCVVAEAHEICSGTTKNTTAKITAQHGLIYNKILNSYGKEKAQLYYAANTAAIAEYKQLSYLTPCDFEEKDAYVYSIDRRIKLEDEYRAYLSIGINGGISEKNPLPFKTAGAICMNNQAQFNPLKFLYGIAEGLEIYENTFINEIKDGTTLSANGTIKAKHIVLCTHFPLINIPGFYFMKLYQHRSYALALENGPDIGGMYLDEREDGHSFRNYNGYLIIGGGDHLTGKKGGCFDVLRNLAKGAYPNCKEHFSWATQDCMSLDSIPYVGVHRKSKPALYVATGFNKWGMTGSMLAATLISELITEDRSIYSGLLSPQRSMLHPQLAVNAYHSLTGLANLGTKRCPHMGCALKWNSAEHTWDCPCHGSRFEKNGKLIDNPAKRDKKIK